MKTDLIREYVKSQKEPSRTPTPWGHFEDETNHWLERADKTAFTSGLQGVMSNEDAAYIVTCVNAHEMLIEVIQMTLAKMDSIAMMRNANPVLLVHEREALRSALAQAEGNSK